MDTTTTIRVIGMTCGHCASAVAGELSKVSGVSGVDVDLASGTVEISSEGPLDPGSVAVAIDEAGYELADELGTNAPAGDADVGSCCGGTIQLGRTNEGVPRDH